MNNKNLLTKDIPMSITSIELINFMLLALVLIENYISVN